MLFWGDFDANGRDDVLNITPDRRLRLLENSGDGTFEDVTEFARLNEIEHANLALWQDFDGDGLADLFIGTSQGACRLLRNDGGVFLDVTADCGLDAAGNDRAARWMDYDRDGRLDLHLVYDDQNVFYHALPDGRFEAVTLPATLISSPGLAIGPPSLSDEVEAQAGGQDLQGSGSGTHELGGGHSAGRAAAGGSALDPEGLPTLSQSSLPPPTSSGLCAHSIKDTGAGGCVQASSVAELGKLYPLSDEFFVQEANGYVGLGTTSPSRPLSLISNEFWPMLIEGNTNPGMTINNTSQGSTQWSIYHDSSDALTFRDSWNGLTRMTISGSSGHVAANTSVSVGTDLSVGSDLSIGGELTGDNRAPGMLRQGSETGTAQPPTTAFVYNGVLTRRIISTVTTAGDAIALSTSMRLERDGTNGGFQVSYDAGALPDQVVFGTALRANGTIVPIVFNFGGPGSAGTQSLYADTDVVRLELTFGTTFNTRETTDVTLIRSNGDSWWVGTVTSTINQ